MQDPLSSSTTGRDHPLTWAEWKLLTQSGKDLGSLGEELSALLVYVLLLYGGTW